MQTSWKAFCQILLLFAAAEVKPEADAVTEVAAAAPAADAMEGVQTEAETPAPTDPAEVAAGSDAAAPAATPAETPAAEAPIPNGDVKPEGDIDMADADGDADVEAPPGASAGPPCCSMLFHAQQPGTLAELPKAVKEIFCREHALVMDLCSDCRSTSASQNIFLTEASN